MNRKEKEKVDIRRGSLTDVLVNGNRVPTSSISSKLDRKASSSRSGSRIVSKRKPRAQNQENQMKDIPVTIKSTTEVPEEESIPSIEKSGK